MHWEVKRGKTCIFVSWEFMSKCVVNGKVWFKFASNLPRVQTINISKYLLKFTLFAKIVVWPYLQMQAKNVRKTMICSNFCSWFPRIQKSAFACGLFAFAVRAKIINCYKFNCVLNLQICKFAIYLVTFTMGQIWWLT